MTKPRFTRQVSNILILLCLAFFISLSAVASPRAVTVIVDGRTLALDQPAMLTNGRVMVPLRGIFESLGASVQYDNVTRSITATRANSRVQLFTNSRQAIVDGQTYQLDAPPMVLGGRVMVPLRFVSEALKAQVSWQAYDQTVSILSRTGGVDLPSAPNGQSPYPNTQPAQPLAINLQSPNPGGKVPQVFDVRGVTQPNATVQIQVIADKSWMGMIFGVKHEQILNTSTTADAHGNFHFRVDTGNLPSNTHLVVTMHALNSQGQSSDELRMELSTR